MSVSHVPLGELVDFKGGGTPNKKTESYWNGGIPWASVKDFKSTELGSTLDTISEDGLNNSASNLIPRGTVIVPTRMAVGKAAISTIDLAINQDLKALLPKSEIDTRYLLHVLLASSHKLERYATGATVKGITLNVLRELEIPLRPLSEQNRIAAILDLADALRSLRRQSLSRLSALEQAIFFEMFGDPIVNSKQLPTKKLGSMGKLDRGRSQHRPRNDPILLGGPYPLIQTGDVSRANDFIRSYTSTYSEIGLRQSRMWDKGTLCITIAANIADTALLDFPACFPDSVVGFDGGSESRNYFVHSWLKITRGELERIAPAVAQKNINLAILRDLDIIAPNNEEIEEFYRRVTNVHSQRQLFEQQAKYLDGLFASLQSRAFRGEL